MQRLWSQDANLYGQTWKSYTQYSTRRDRVIHICVIELSKPLFRPWLALVRRQTKA